MHENPRRTFLIQPETGARYGPHNNSLQSIVPRMADEADPGNVLAVKSIGSGRLIALLIVRAT